MPVTIDPATSIITIPDTFLTYVAGPVGVGGLYELDVDELRNALNAIAASEEGIPYPDTHIHKGETLLSGVPYARSVEIINGYTVEFSEDSFDHYAVRCVGANHNIADVKIINTISLIIGNAAGLIKADAGSGTAPTTGEIWADPQASSITTLNSRNDNL